MLDKLLNLIKRPQNKSVSIQTDELLARFVFSSSHFNSKRVKHAAFMPHKGEVSVFRVSNLSENDIWDIGVNHVGAMRGKSPKSRADIHAAKVINTGLSVVAETSNHKLHANIIDWPEGRDDQLDLAMELANSSKLYLRKVS